MWWSNYHEHLSPLCNRFPILPAGFGFCITDADGEVLIHSDRRRNVSENFIQESGENPLVESCIYNKNSLTIENVSFYGHDHSLQIRPVKGQPLTLVVYYESDFLAPNILRTILFSIQTMGFIFLGIAAVILAYMFTGARPGILRFKIQKKPWIRPLFSANFYHSCKANLLAILIIYSAFFFVVIIGFKDLSPLLYMSLLLPFNCLMMYIRLRRSERGSAEPMTTIFLVLILIGSIIINLIVDDHSIGSATGLLTIGYEAMSLIAIYGYSKLFSIKKNQNPGEVNQDTPLKCIRDYRASFMLSVLLISVFTLQPWNYLFWHPGRKIPGKESRRPVCEFKSWNKDLNGFITSSLNTKKTIGTAFF